MTSGHIAGLGACLVSAAYLIGIVAVLGPLAPLGLGTDSLDPFAVLAFHKETPWLLPLWVTILYDFSALGTALAGLGVAGLVKRDLHLTAQASAGVALIWSGLTLASGMVARTGLAELARLAPTDPDKAADVWVTLHLIETGLSGRTEVLGGVWIALACFAAQQVGKLSTVLSFVGAAVALAGLSTYLPAASQTGGMVFGIGALLWFASAGVEWFADAKASRFKPEK